MRSLLSWMMIAFFVSQVHADVVYQQAPDPIGGLFQSSWWEPDDSDYDQWVWDSFTFGSGQALTEITWRGGYIYGGTYTNYVTDFTVAIHASIAAGTEPNVVDPPLISYETGGDAEETYAGVFGGITMYDYHFVLPSPFQATAGTKYWIQIEAWQSGLPEWGLAKGTGGNGAHFRWLRGAHMYQSAPGDVAFTLFGSGAPTFNISAMASPANGGTIQGAGAYPVSSVASLLAYPNPSFGFSHWSEDGVSVSTSNPYSFSVDADRTLVANFIPAYTVSTSAFPSYGGSTSGDGVYNAGEQVTVMAVPVAEYAFVNWTEFGAPVSTSPSYMFNADRSRTLVAHFELNPFAVMFDFENAPVYTSLPIELTVNGVTANLSASGQGFSVQFANTMGFTPAGFSGLCIYPNSVFAADLMVDFSESLTSFSILYSSQELACHDSATMRVTAFSNGVQVGTNTVTASNPGTWPSETLPISVPGGFNRVVVHYEARPPTCQDWGPIFLADNMAIVRVPFDCSGVNNCSGHGMCIAPNTCLCDSGWTGPNCATALGVPCFTHTDCVLTNADVCRFHECSGGDCVSTPIQFGNVNGSANQVPNLDDILCVLAGFADFNACPNGDLKGTIQCERDGMITLDDILAVLGAFSGANPCQCQP